MKKIVFNLFVLIMSFLIAGSADVFAQDKKLEQKQKNAAKSFINQTTGIIKAANNAKKANPKAKKKKKGEDEEQGEAWIGKAIDHQKKAVELYNQGTAIEKAIYHSMKARKLAFIAIKEYKGEMQEQWEVNPEVLFKEFDKDKDFYKKVRKTMKDLKKPEIGDMEGELESGVEVSTADPEAKDTKAWQELDKSLKVK
jgi:hypothetical protein